jgi:hypothetical protein
MSNPLPMPEHLGNIEPPKDYYFDGEIPRLKDLLPKLHGQPGFVYLQVCVQNQRRAQDEGWNEVGNTVIYTIKGPKGEAHCKLYAIGKSIPGQSHASGRRVCYVDDEVETLTGLPIQPENKIEVKDAQEQTPKGQTSQVENQVQKTSRPVVVEKQPTDGETASKTKA